ncbi:MULTISPECIES: short-chain fatty acid transporter [unclassified Francisella]|uniref:short-chain fatty acid transporter n=1 Tax=unclassified Francisella TaxID=2610885 RepID=UPI002E36AA18|nr:MULTISPECIES: TIGR00366 family protein [unclassified Francisella]MED7819475.1 TIGR00366 family protein [Francisella sp. 19S2-4]MED7830264.1 TIGR00366 family protein [Francisella sp. 19S2-10]
MIKLLGSFFSKVVSKYMPDSFIFVVLLTLLTLFISIFIKNQPLNLMIEAWGDGLWSLLPFAMQMVLILVIGCTLAASKPIKKAIQYMVGFVNTEGQAIIVVTLISSIVCWLNWAVGLVVGAIIAKEIAKKIKNINYGLLVASAYTGFLVWHAGLSGSIPLIIATSTTGNLAALTDGHIIPLSQTIFSYKNYVPVLILIFTLPILNWMMKDPSKSLQKVEIKEEDKVFFVSKKMTPAERLEDSKVLCFLFVIIIFYYLISYVIGGGNIDFNIINLFFLGMGLVLYGSLTQYFNAFRKSLVVCAGVVIQFPFYAGIMSLMMKSGIDNSISDFFISVSNVHTFPLYTFFSSAIINIFIPSGGGHWVVQGPFVMPAAKALGVSQADAAMAIAWGEAWANMLQPFWAIPLLAVAGLKIRDIMGYCIVAMLWSGIVLSSCIYFLW